MFTLLTLLTLLIPGASASTTTVSLDSSEVTDTVPTAFTTGCGAAVSLQAVATVTFTLSKDAVVDLSDFALTARGRYAKCKVTLDDASLSLDGGEIWSQTISASGSGASSADWYLSYTYAASDLSDQVLTKGTHTVSLTVNGSGQTELLATDQSVGARVQVDIEYGSDWDGDGYDALVVGGDDCDDDAPDTHPGVSDPVDGLDNDCDGLTDEDAPTDTGGEDTGGGDTGGDDTGTVDTGSVDTGTVDTGTVDTGGDDTGSTDTSDTSDTGDSSDTSDTSDTSDSSENPDTSSDDTASDDTASDDTGSLDSGPLDSGAVDPLAGGVIAGGACATAPGSPQWPALLGLAVALLRGRRRPTHD